MTDREALLRGVAANPDEDTPRLAYADLLDELGGEANTARARFIRLQIDTYRGPGDTGGSWAFDRKLEEAAALANQFAHEWRRDLPAWAYVLHGPFGRTPADLFSRGFIERVRAKAKPLSLRADELFSATPVRSLEVQAGSAELIPAVFDNPALARLKTLAIRWRGVSDALASALAGCRWLSELQELDLSGCRLTERAARILSRSERLPQVRVIRLEGDFVSAQVVSTLAESVKLRNLREFGLRGTRLWPDILAALRAGYPDKQFRD
jgi:uncharacterized protein (TIGR02996 family)